jgi:hypothetical protein
MADQQQPPKQEPPSNEPSLNPPYVRELAQRGSLHVWSVDGTYVRGHMDVEFTNFGQHYRYPYIPRDELWIDVEGDPDEQPFFLDHLLIEHRLMAAGKSYGEALEAANRKERSERRRSGDVAQLTRNGLVLPDGRDAHRQLWKQLENGVSVWIVDGRLVRSVFNLDFTAGGHDKVYEFVPRNEVWIDDDIVERERGYVLLHELHERNLMAAGVPYSRAHADSSKVEYHCRHHPDELHEALMAEGWA